MTTFDNWQSWHSCKFRALIRNNNFWSDKWTFVDFEKIFEERNLLSLDEFDNSTRKKMKCFNFKFLVNILNTRTLNRTAKKPLEVEKKPQKIARNHSVRFLRGSEPNRAVSCASTLLLNSMKKQATKVGKTKLDLTFNRLLQKVNSVSSNIYFKKKAGAILKGTKQSLLEINSVQPKIKVTALIYSIFEHSNWIFNIKSFFFCFENIWIIS